MYAGGSGCLSTRGWPLSPAPTGVNTIDPLCMQEGLGVLSTRGWPLSPTPRGVNTIVSPPPSGVNILLIPFFMQEGLGVLSTHGWPLSPTPTGANTGRQTTQDRISGNCMPGIKDFISDKGKCELCDRQVHVERYLQVYTVV